MLRIDLKSGPRWISLGNGVRLKVEPLTTAIMASCRRDPAVAAVNEAHRAALEGADVPEAIPDDVRDDLALAMAKAVARRVVLDWEGVGDADGKPIKVTPEGVDALMDVWVLFEAFQSRYVAAGFLLESEKNVSSPSLNGTSAGARRTAVPAKGRARTARKS
jgi:hypothetical protein